MSHDCRPKKQRVMKKPFLGTQFGLIKLFRIASAILRCFVLVVKYWLAGVVYTILRAFFLMSPTGWYSPIRLCSCLVGRPIYRTPQEHVNWYMHIEVVKRGNVPFCWDLFPAYSLSPVEKHPWVILKSTTNNFSKGSLSTGRILNDNSESNWVIRIKCKIDVS